MPYYDWMCVSPECGAVTTVQRPMARAADPVVCGECGAPARRVYQAGRVIIRPLGYSRKPDDPRYWDGFTDPVPPPLTWQGGRSRRTRPSPQYEGVGPVSGY